MREMQKRAPWLKAMAFPSAIRASRCDACHIAFVCGHMEIPFVRASLLVTHVWACAIQKVVTRKSTAHSLNLSSFRVPTRILIHALLANICGPHPLLIHSFSRVSCLFM
ncbi:hypothetical protein CY34DRAFT_180463 [Suillus luteus UH-Slu-Lm8-n1]|uniref:Uncharacterized protein n=1 Tax=Suillus luteus UH-Slu-Lm8-n1 TaxID=930992 RepID=A0A0D0AVD9_9AGAM|nr:hypothetical protein CY34DRAFT_180463 [Suillus luteus UH-Slu-Lm8-n1]